MRIRRFHWALVIVLSVTLATAQNSAQQRPLQGFDSQGADRQRALEKQFDSFLKKEEAREWMKRLSAKPHHLGSPYGKENAEFIAGLFRSWGYDTEIERFDVLFPTPKTRILEMTAPERFTAKLEEPVLKEDATSGQKSEQLSTYNAYSINGDVTGQLVYVNYGVPQDYEALERRGIDVKGKIVIARYGGSWRGIKPKVAAEHGAIGCIIYSDPRDDGYFAGDVYPKGAWRNESGVQRGSVADMPLYPGDPLTPGVGATPNAKRLDIKDAQTLTKIPVLPISYSDALTLLKALEGPVAPAAWRGALPITYHMGPGRATVHMKLEFDFKLVPAYDVIARLRGSERPDEWVIRGNHHDAWVNGAEDPISGLVAVLEEARAAGELAKSGWRPKRTIIYCAWDGEEPGLLGSTEWAEAHAHELQAHGVAYINSDSNGRGYLDIEGSHTLEKFSNDISREIPDPETKLSTWKRRQLREIANAKTAEQREDIRKRTDLRIPALGSGSDYSAFLQHDGVASLNIGFGGEDGGGIYHSIYDDYYWFTHFSDTDFVYGRALAQTGGTAVIRLSDADLLPFEFGDLADTVQAYLKELKTLSQKTQDDIRERNREIEEGVFKATNDPRRPLVAPAVEAVPPHLNFAPMETAVEALTRSAGDYHKALEQASANGSAALASTSLVQVNKMLIESERKFTTAEGLPNRPWFKHQLYAPGFYTGYAAKTVPAVREAIEQKQWKRADDAIVVVAHVLEDEAALISSAAQKLSAAK